MKAKNKARQAKKKDKKVFACANLGCTKLGNHPKCVKCKRKRYCSKECQTSDWKRHQSECKQWQNELERDLERQMLGKSVSVGVTSTQDQPGIVTTKVAGAGKGAGELKPAAECPICMEELTDPLAPCVEQPSHKFCRTCIQSMHKLGVDASSVCPLCRGSMQSADGLFYKAIGWLVQAEKATAKKESAYHLQYGSGTASRAASCRPKTPIGAA